MFKRLLPLLLCLSVSVYSVLICGCLLVSEVAYNELKDDYTTRAVNCSVALEYVLSPEHKSMFSGTIISYQGKNYVLTCGHATEGIENLQNITVIYRKCDNNGDIIDEIETLATPLAVSNSEESGGCDIAVFLLEKTIIQKGALLKDLKFKTLDRFFHVGNPYGRYTQAILEGKVVKPCLWCNYGEEPSSFVIGTCEVRGGCSGGGVFKKSYGIYWYCGMVSRADKVGYVFIKPMCQIKQFLEKNDLGFLLQGE